MTRLLSLESGQASLAGQPGFLDAGRQQEVEGKSAMTKYVCDICSWVYDPEQGDPDGGVAAGTAFEDLPDDWMCPVCGVGKDRFTALD